MQDLNVLLLNDSFPPLIDGVANTVKNYADVIKSKNGNPIVVTPSNPEADDTNFDYPIIRYPGIDVRKFIGYIAGNPFSSSVLRDLEGKEFSIMHSHCPFSSTMLSRCLQDIYHKPLVMTYHTKFDIDIKNAIHGKLLQEEAINLIVDNINSCDEVWCVSNGAGKNLRSLGYKGDYIVMKNGVDIKRGKIEKDLAIKNTKEYNIRYDVPIFLFVGRMMWYKGIKLILDALSGLKSQDIDFQMIFIGKGKDEKEIKKYAKEIKVFDKCIFTGPIFDRTVLSSFYSIANLFLFPSDFDTNGLVVREASALELPSVLLKDSAASEGVTKNVDGFFTDNTPQSLACLLSRLVLDLDNLKKVGINASNNLYLSWEDAINVALDRYQVIIENYNSGKYKKRKTLSTAYYQAQANLMESYKVFDKIKTSIKNEIEESMFYDINYPNR